MEKMSMLMDFNMKIEPTDSLLYHGRAIKEENWPDALERMEKWMQVYKQTPMRLEIKIAMDLTK